MSHLPARLPNADVDQRIDVLDAIRGIALAGILLANLMSFMGADMLDASTRLAMPWGAAGEAVLFSVNWLVEGKFYSMFSILLGVGYALQRARAGARGTAPGRFEAFFRRRMAVLIAIGLTHMLFLWCGDILTLYGVLGLLLPFALALAPRARTALMCILFLAPMAIHAAAVVSDGRYDPRRPFAAASAEVRQALGIEQRNAVELFARGHAADYWAWNAGVAVTRPGTYLQSGRPFKVLALFMIGAWLGAILRSHPQWPQDLLRRTAIVGTAIGLPASYAYAFIKMAAGSTFLVSLQGIAQTTAYTLGTTPLALAYLALLVIAWETSCRRALEWFVPLGRMALSAYIAQTVIQVLIFTSVGLRLSGRVPFVALPLVAAVVIVAERTICLWWLTRHAQGPLEHWWRRVAYQRHRDLAAH